MRGIRLESGWGALVPCMMMPLVALMELSFSEWRVLMVVAFLATVVMLYHKRLRHYMLLPSGIALVGALTAISVNFTRL
ncbi:DUF1435 domain-containing protein [Erwinia sp. Eh17-17]|uniref:DUF1435 domain-containing protein n=1 Tax=Erwinia sp. Eh17-17 TaxID=3080330 RepID=UPI00320A402B